MGKLTFILCLTSSVFISSNAISQKVLLKLKRNNREVKTSISQYRNKRLITKNGTFHYKEILSVSFESAKRKYDKIIKSLGSSGIQIYFDYVPIKDPILLFNGVQLGIPFLIGYDFTTFNLKNPQKAYVGLDFATSIFLSYMSLGGAVIVDKKSQWALGLRYMSESELHPDPADNNPYVPTFTFITVDQNGPQFTIEHFLTNKKGTTLHFKLGLFIGTSSIFPMLTVSSNFRGQ